jgi:hypothetical protein
MQRVQQQTVPVPCCSTTGFCHILAAAAAVDAVAAWFSGQGWPDLAPSRARAALQELASVEGQRRAEEALRQLDSGAESTAPDSWPRPRASIAELLVHADLPGVQQRLQAKLCFQAGAQLLLSWRDSVDRLVAVRLLAQGGWCQAHCPLLSLRLRLLLP